MKADFYKEKVVMITGGSSGIGLAMAQEFAKQKAILLLVARDVQKLQTAKRIVESEGATTVSIHAADVSKEEEITKAITETGTAFGRIDVLINCAGIATCGRFADQTIADLQTCMNSNYLGAVYASKAAWPWLKKAKGQLSFVSSVAGYLGLIGYSSYAPTKFALNGLAECLRFEGKDDGISVSILFPPDTDTAMYRYEQEHTLFETKALSKKIKAKSAEHVARKYMQGLQQKRFAIYCDADSRLLRWFKNNFPSLFVYMVNRTIKKARKERQNAGSMQQKTSPATMQPQTEQS